MNEIGTKLQSFMQTVNAESKGFGKTAILAAEKGIKAENLDSVNNAINNEKSTSGIFNSMNTLRDKRGNSNSLSGFVIDYGLNELNKITKRYFPYEYSSIQGVFNALSRISGRKESSLTASEEFKTKMFTEIKSFIFSNPNLLGISEDPEKYRRKLFIDE
jgi:hypothetical protein